MNDFKRDKTCSAWLQRAEVCRCTCACGAKSALLFFELLWANHKAASLRVEKGASL